jgi:hypothetical protein
MYCTRLSLRPIAFDYVLRPRSVSSDERSQNILDLWAVRWRILRDAFESVYASNPDIHVLAADLVYRASEAICDLALAVDLDLTPGCDRADKDEEPRHCLQESAAGVVSKLRLGLLKLNARFRSPDAFQLSFA